MKIIDSIKNALFEVEYVEVDNEPEEDKKKKKEKKKDKKEKEEKPIAKKVVLSNKKEQPPKEPEPEVKIEQVEEPIENTRNDFKVMDDNDFKVDDNPYNNTPRRETRSESRASAHNRENYEHNNYDDNYQDDYNDYREERYDDYREPQRQVRKQPEPEYNTRDEYDYERPTKQNNNVIYRNESKKDSKPYGIDEQNQHLVEDYGKAFEKKDERLSFKPSPIISPIYGVLDKNYKKEDVVQKKEVRISSARENVNVDDVRAKAYGVKEEAKKQAPPPVKEEPAYVEEDDDDDDNLLVDLSSDDDKPEIKKVTVGDAMEYFQDLGLEYNVDYKDATKEKATGRRTKEKYQEEPELVSSTPAEEPEIEAVDDTGIDAPVVTNNKEINVEDLESEEDGNLFDLIENMYTEDK